MGSVRLLDDSLLAELEESWRGAGVRYLGELRPGLADGQIDQRIERLGFELPEEARRWYRWHDGSDGHYVVEGRVMTSLEEDVDSTAMLRADDQLWVPGWLRAMDEQPFVVFDCRGGFRDPVPVWHYYLGFEMPTRPVFGSIGEMVLYWKSLVDEGAMTWTVEGGWRLTEPVPPEVIERLGGVPTD
jgi:hypothetical protein